MDEFNVEEWERQQVRAMRNIYSYNRPAATPIEEYSPKPTRASVPTIAVVLLLAVMCGMVIWGAFDDLTEHFKPAPPVPVQEETRPDISGQIRTLERMIVEAKQLNADLQELHKQLTK